MNDLEKRALTDSDHQRNTNYIMRWVVDPLAIVTLVFGFSWMAFNQPVSKQGSNSSLVKTSKSISQDTKYSPIPITQPAPYQVETQNSEYFPERPQI